MSLTERITALTTYANEVTGASDTTLSEAIATLADGYGNPAGSADWTYDASAGDLTQRMQALINYSNTITGAGDSTLSECVATLASGYGSGETWDYEWYATSGELPDGATSSDTPTYTDDYMTCAGLNVSFSNFTTSNFIIRAELSCDGNSTPNNPQIGAKSSSTGYSAKMWANSSKTLTGGGVTFSSSITVDSDFHVWEVRYNDGTFTVYYDDTLVATGTGRSSSFDLTGIANASTNTSTYSYKSIKYRAYD